MSKRILIDTSNSDETRVAVTLNGKLDDYEIEAGKSNAVKGDVYLAKITRVEPSLQAAFVDFGAGRNGFLPLTEIHPDYFKIPIADQDKVKSLIDNLKSDTDEDLQKNNDITEENNEDISNEDISNEDKNNLKEDKIKEPKKEIKTKDPKKEYTNFFRKYHIQDVIKPRQVILVQVNKEERGFKGAALTTFLSFAGRYCVLMPNSLNNDGISRKIGDIDERKKLKVILSTVNIPENMSIIVRTAGIGKNKKEISKDLNYLTAQWNKIRELTLKSEAPKLIYEEGSIVKRIIRDMLTDEVDEILVDGKSGYENVKKLTKSLVPNKLKNVKLFKVNKNSNESLFSSNNIETQINELFSLNVKLESGGSIVINTTEALVAVDVNSGKNTSERNIENTALKTNLEAAEEIARQLRLRDLGGLVVIDFIDMDDYRNNFKVEKTIKNALYKDRARVQVGRISMFGLLELSRQRLRSSLIDKSFEKCHYCNGSGLILNTTSISQQILKVIKEKLGSNKEAKIRVKCNSTLAEILMNEKRKEINQLEMQYNSSINFIFDNHYSLHEPTIDIINDEIKLSKSNKEIKIHKSNKEIKISKTNKEDKKVKKKTIKKKLPTKNKEIKIKPRKKKKPIITKDKIDGVEVIKNDEVLKPILEVSKPILKEKNTKKKESSKTSQKDQEKSGWWSN